MRADALALLGDTNLARILSDSARMLFEEGVTADPPTRLLAEIKALAGSGRAANARTRLDSLHSSLQMRERKYWLSLAGLRLILTYVMLGDHERAIDALEEQIDPPSFINEHVLRLEPRLRPLYNEPRFQALLNRQRKSSS